MKDRWIRAAAVAVALFASTSLSIYLTLSASGQTPMTIVDEWATVQPPPPPALRPVTVDPRMTALLNRAIARGMSVIYSTTTGATTADIWWQVRPLGAEPVVASGADKFFGTDLERILRDRGIRTVIVTGTAAHGAVLFTGTSAALRGLQVIVPVDGMSAGTPYIEQYVAWHLANAPTIGARVTLTKTDMISF